MPAAVTVENPIRTLVTRHLQHRAWRWVAVAAVILLALISAAIIFLAIYWPFTKQGLIDVFQERTVRSVTVARFHRTYFPPGCVAEGISFLHRKHKNKPPLITIDQVIVRGTYWGLIPPRKHLSSVRVVGMHVTVPPSDTNGKPNPVMPLTHSTSGPAMVIGTVIADGAILDFMQRQAGKPLMRIVVNRLTLDGVGNDQPLSYHATIFNTQPPGRIDSSGQFGTWNADDPGRTPVHGSYNFRDANLAYFKAVSGTLFSRGSFTGTLGEMEVKGNVDVPNFKVTDTARTRELISEFRAKVNATNGDVFIEDATARFDNTAVAFAGAVAGTAAEDRKAVSMDIAIANGRVEDVLRLFISDKQSPMTGDVTLRAHFDLPPQHQSFLRDMKMRGNFGVGGKFTNQELETSLTNLSRSALKKRKDLVNDPASAISDLRGHADVTNATAILSNVSLSIPGARCWMHGTYGLIDYKINLHGRLITDGNASAATTGFKSFLLKAMTPFLKKKGREVVPFKITGTYHKTSIGTDFGAKR